jgi:nitroimidazol reductase NimA-like FMN-containing flavoprotein (pyridoxamine 5'-phosphate oxidase superfamily)/GNAT superfamily N-acetyltransferase
MSMTDSRSSTVLEKTPRTTVKRKPDRGSHERALIHAIIDEALICQVGFTIDGVPFVLPTAHARIGDALYLHGARVNRMLHALCDGRESAVCFTLLDGLVFSRTAFHHSMNYRSVLLLARGSEVTNLDEKRRALHALVEHVAQGRMQEVAVPSETELRGTLVVRLPIVEASAKLRTGPPIDSASELELPHCAGVLPLGLRAGAFERAPNLAPSIMVSSAITTAAQARSKPELVPHEWRREELVISTDRSRLDRAFVHRFLSDEAYWALGLTEARFARGLEHSLCFGMYRGTTQLAFARVVSDFSRFAYLADVFVREDERGKKLGSWLIECVLAHPELSHITRWLLGTRDAHGLYERFGFRRAPPDRYMVRNDETAL